MARNVFTRKPIGKQNSHESPKLFERARGDVGQNSPPDHADR